MKASGKSSLLAAAGLAALAAAGTAGTAGTAVQQVPQFVFRGYGVFANAGTSRSTKRYPQMIVDKAEIAEWNRNVKTRQVLRWNARHA